MNAPTHLPEDQRGTPAERVEMAVERWGADEVIHRCRMTLGSGTAAVTGELRELAMVLGGVVDDAWLDGGKPPGHAYWARVWAARALRYVWHESAGPSVVSALGDEHWRVREMAANVVGQREVDGAVHALTELTERGVDEVPRVRAAAAEALAVVGEAEDASVLLGLADDPDRRVSDAASAALTALARRLDRDV